MGEEIEIKGACKWEDVPFHNLGPTGKVRERGKKKEMGDGRRNKEEVCKSKKEIFEASA